MKQKPSCKIYKSLDQVSSKLTAIKGWIISGIMMESGENFYVSIDGKKLGKNGNFPFKITFDDNKENWKWNLSCITVKVHNMDTDQLVFGDKKKLNLALI